MFVSMSKDERRADTLSAVAKGCEIFLVWPSVHSWLCWFDLGRVVILLWWPVGTRNPNCIFSGYSNHICERCQSINP